MFTDGPIRFSLEEMATIIEDLMRIADELNRSGDEVNAYLLDLVTNRLLDRSFGGDAGPISAEPNNGCSCRWTHDIAAELAGVSKGVRSPLD